MVRALRWFATAMVVSVLLTACSKQSAPVRTTQPAAPTAQPAASLQELNDQAFTEIQRKNWPEAIRLAEQAVTLAPEDAAARFNLGLALYRTGQYLEARAHLEKAYALNTAQVEPGWFLALTLEQLGDTASALSVLTDLAKRFPQDQDVAQAIIRLQTGQVTWTPPAGAKIAYFFGDSMAVDFGGGKPIAVVNPTGQTLWSYTLPGPLVKYVPEEGGRRVLAVTEGETLLLIDPDVRRARAVTGVRAGPHGSVYHYEFRGDLLYAGHDVWKGDHYGYTPWQAYNVTNREDQVIARPLGELAMGQQTVTIAADGKTALITTPYGTAEVYVNGTRRPTAELSGSLTPGGDAVYRLEHGALRVTSLAGAPLVARPPELYSAVTALPRTDDFWYVLGRPDGGYAILRKNEVTAHGAEGRLLGVTQQAILLQSEQNVQVVDLYGHLLATFPERSGSVTPDGRWFYQSSAGEIRAYRLPQ